MKTGGYSWGFCRKKSEIQRPSNTQQTIQFSVKPPNFTNQQPKTRNSDVSSKKRELEGENHQLTAHFLQSKTSSYTPIPTKQIFGEITSIIILTQSFFEIEV